MSDGIESIVRHRSFDFDATLYDTYVKEGSPSNVPTNLTGWTFRSQVRTVRGNKVVANLNVVSAVPTSGAWQIRHDRTFTSSLKDSKEALWFDVVGIDGTGKDHQMWPPEPIQIVTYPTNPDDNSSDDFIPGGGGAIYHTHPISQVIGLQQILDDLTIWEAGVTSASINADDELEIVKNGIEFWIPLFRR